MTRRLVVLLLLLAVADARTASADDRLEKIMLLWPSRDYDTLRVRIDEAVAVYREAGDPRREATAHLLLSLIDASVADVQNARVHFGEATSRLEAAGDFLGTALAYWMFAEHERFLGRPSDHVRAFYEKCFAMLEKAKSPSAAFSIDVLLIVGPLVGLPPAEYEPNAEKPEIVSQLLEVFARTGYGAQFLAAGDLEKADEQLRRAKDAAVLFGGRVDPPIDRHVGNLRRQQWRFDEARQSYQKALDGLKVLRPVGFVTPKRLRVEVWSELAELEMLSGRVDDALAWNDRALELVRAEKSPETEVVVLNRRAELLVRAARFAAAEKVFAQALTLAEKHEYDYLLVSIHLNSAQMNRTRGRYGAMAAHMEKSLDALARANEPFREPEILGNLAMSYSLLDADDSARLALERARQAADRGGRCADVAAIDLIEATRKFAKDEISLADFLKAMEQFSRTPDALSMSGAEQFLRLTTEIMDSAPVDPRLPVSGLMLSPGMVELLQAGALFSERREFARARELATKGLELNPNAKHRAGALAIIGGTYLAEGDDDKAIAFFTRAADALDTAAAEAPADPLLSGSAAAAGWSSPVLEMLLQLLVNHGRHEEAFAISERARARVFLQMVGNARVTPRGSHNYTPAAQEAETLRTQMMQWQQQARLAPATEINDKLLQARRRYEGLMTRVKASNPDYAAMTTVESLRLDAIRRELPSNTTLVAYFLTANGAHAWVLDRTLLHYVPLPFGPKTVARAECAAKRFRAAGRGVRPLDASCEPIPVEELYGRLFAPLRAHVRNPRLVIVPHGVLNYLPFAAFRDPGTNRYLIEDYTITYAPSASSIRFLREKETPMNGKALVIGAPAGVSPELPGAMREARMVGATLQSVPMVGAAAKESLLYRLKGGVDLVHIAAHGFYEPATPLFSRIALAEGDGSDGNLEVHEILSDVDLTGVNLVVLSACQTAVGKDSAGDEIVGLTRALMYAGTPGVISTLWDIDDDAAAALMEHFYRRLRGGDSAADALRYAQLQLMRGEYPDPRQWAAFTLNGDPQGRWKTRPPVQF